LREFIKSGENIFKIGKSTQNGTRRIAQYPKGTQLILQRKCLNCHTIEKKIKDVFGKKYILRTDIGTEYFEGDCNEMITDINSIIEQEFVDLSVVYSEGEENSEDVKFLVKTYDDYIRFNGNRFHIVITNKNKCEGYIKFKNSNHIWRKLYSTDEDDNETLEGYLEHYSEKDAILNNSGHVCRWEDFGKTRCIDEDDNETLEGYLEHYSEKDAILNNSGHVCRWEDFGKTRCIDVEYDYEQLKKDVCRKFYNKYPIFYKLKYHEFVVYVLCQSGHKIYNIIDNSYTDIPINQILYEPCPSSPLYSVKGILNTHIVDDILNVYVEDNSMLKEFKKLCSRVLVKKSSETFIFNDYGRSHLTSWLADVLYTFADNGKLSSNEYYKCPKEYAKQIRDKNFRCVYIDTKIEKRKKRTIIDHFTKLGIKNIIFIRNNAKDNKKYDEGKLTTFLKENKQMIEDNFLEEHKNYNIDDLFYSRRCLFLHFIRWCVREEREYY
jgi:hypothetical protein